MFAVWINYEVVPALGYTALFNVFGVMTCISMFINYKLQYSFETFMPFIKTGNTTEEKQSERSGSQTSQKLTGAK